MSLVAQVLAVGDFSAFAAAERLGVAVGGPVCFSCMLMTGSIGDYLLEGSANPPLLLAGIVGCLCAVLADSQSHATKAHPVEQTGLARADSAAAMEVGVQPTPAQQELGDLGSTAPVTAATKTTGASLDELPPQQQSKRRNDFALGMVVAVGGGVIGGLWTVLSTLASHVHEMRPLVLLFYFHVGELLFIVPVVLVYGGLFGGTTRARVLWRMMRVLTRRQVLWTLASGLCIALGYLFYFGTKGRVPRPVAFGFGCAAGSTSMLYGLLCFREYVGAPLRKKALLLIALLLYPSSIALIAASMG